MNKTVKIVLGVIAVALIIAGTFFWKGENLQGRIKKQTRNSEQTTGSGQSRNLEKELTASISPYTPSGTKTTGIEDKVLTFDLCAKNQTYNISKIVLGFYSSGSINASNYVYKTIKGAPGFLVDKAECQKDSGDGNIAEYDICSWEKLAIDDKTCKTLEVTIDSQNLIKTTVNDDLLTVSIEKIYDTDGNEIKVKALPLKGPTLKY